MAEETINIAVIDDEESVRELLRRWLNEHDLYQCVGAWSGNSEMQSSLTWGKPDVVLLDMHIGSEEGTNLLPEIKQSLPNTKVIMLTGEEEYYWIKQSLERGADGYLLKSGMPDNLPSAITDVLEGGKPLSGKVSGKLIEQNIQPAQGSSELDRLSAREREMLHGLSEGLAYKEIAAKHNISVETVRTHARRIFTKLGVQNRTEAVLVYLRS